MAYSVAAAPLELTSAAQAKIVPGLNQDSFVPNYSGASLASARRAYMVLPSSAPCGLSSALSVAVKTANNMFKEGLNPRNLAEVARRYGDIVLLCMGQCNVLVVSSPDMAKEVLQTQGVEKSYELSNGLNPWWKTHSVQLCTTTMAQSFDCSYLSLRLLHYWICSPRMTLSDPTVTAVWALGLPQKRKTAAALSSKLPTSPFAQLSASIFNTGPSASRNMVGEVMLFMAGKKMKAGEEIMICYTDCLVPLKIGENILQSTDYVFLCQCDRCVLEWSLQEQIWEFSERYHALYDKAASEVSSRKKPSYRSYIRRYIMFYSVGHMLNGLTSACWFTYLLIFLTDSGKAVVSAITYVSMEEVINSSNVPNIHVYHALVLHQHSGRVSIFSWSCCYMTFLIFAHKVKVKDPTPLPHLHS